MVPDHAAGGQAGSGSRAFDGAGSRVVNLGTVLQEAPLKGVRALANVVGKAGQPAEVLAAERSGERGASPRRSLQVPINRLLPAVLGKVRQIERTIHGRPPTNECEKKENIDD